MMKLKYGVVLGLVLLFAGVAFPQDYSKIEIPLDYSYMRFNPQNNNIVSAFSLNGGGGGVAFYLNHFIGIEGDLQGYASTSRNFSFPVGSATCPAGCFINASGDLFTYNVGPIFKYRSGHVEPFVETLFGGAHSNVYGNVWRACQLACVTQGSPNNNAWDFMIGGGLDIPVSKSIAIRPAQFDYVLTRFGNQFTFGNNNQSNWRYVAGVVLRF
jgi:hypothetical protein